MVSHIIAALVTLAAATPLPQAHQATVQAAQQFGSGPFTFSSTYNLIATPDKVINPDGEPAPGEEGAVGYYNYGINSELDIICYVSRPT
jgi:hypothetical protein